MRYIDLLLPTLLAFFFYCALPAAGIAWRRLSWRRFRGQYFKVATLPAIDYAAYRRREEGAVFKFTGFFESFSAQDRILCKNDDLRLEISIANANIYILLKNHEPIKTTAANLPLLSKGLNVFAGGVLKTVDGEVTLGGEAASPSYIIFYEKSGAASTEELVCAAGRHSAFYWNPVSICSYAIGSLALVLEALQFISRPAYQALAVISIIFVFLPFLVFLPPGLLLFMLSKKLFEESARIRVNRDIADCKSLGSPKGDSNPAANILETLSWLLLAAAAAIDGILAFLAYVFFTR